MTQVLENLRIHFEEMSHSENPWEKTHTSTPSTSTHSSHHTEIIPSSKDTKDIQELEEPNFSTANNQDSKANSGDTVPIEQEPGNFETSPIF